MEGIKALLSPKSIAVIGVSRSPEKIGYIVFDNLISCFSGKVFPVNPNAESILGREVYKDIFDIKGPVELAVICVPAKIVTKVLESCGKKGIRAAIIITAGFSETGVSGKENEIELLKIAQKHGIRILGPNCLGVINNLTGLNASFATAKLPGKQKVGIFSQSGAMGAAILDFANGHNFGFSYFVSLGNKADVSEIDLIKSWAKDDNVSVGIGYIEDIKDGPAFIEAAEDFTRKKPLIILKGGMTKEGSKAATFHTAALASDEIVFKEAMKEAGVILAENMADLLELAISFSGNKSPKGKKLAVISNAGGPSVLAADACGLEGVELANLSSHTIQGVVKNTKAVSAENPIDLRGDATKDDFKVALEILQKDKNVDGILVIATPQAMTELEQIAWEIVWSWQNGKIPIYVNFIGGEIAEKARDICAEAGVPTFSFPERAIRAFRFQEEFGSKIRTSNKSRPGFHKMHKSVKSIINFSGENLSYNQIASILNLYDIPMAQSYLVKDEKEAVRAFKKIGETVVMKISSPDIKHKTDVGGIILGINSEEEAKKAFQDILQRVKRKSPNAKIEGIMVTKMVKEGLELILGAKNDPVFGNFLMFGFGGIFVELIHDFSIILPPFTTEKIKAMVEKTSVSKIVGGYRSIGSYDGNILIRAIKSLGRLISEHNEIIQIEINPLLLEEGDKGVLGLDAKIEIRKGNSK